MSDDSFTVPNRHRLLPHRSAAVSLSWQNPNPLTFSHSDAVYGFTMKKEGTLVLWI